MLLQSVGLDYYSNNYRFSSVKGEQKSLEESFKPAKGFSFANVEDLNNKLEVLEKKGEKAALMLSLDEQPKDIAEMLQKISGGKYNTFLKNNVEGILVGRQLEEISSAASFYESLGFSLSGSSAKALSNGKMSKIIGVDTFNLTFQSVETQTTADEAFTGYAQTISVFMNELKQAYYISKGDSEDSKGVYEFMNNALADIENYLDEGNSLSFVPASDQDIFKTALSMMADSISSHIEDTYGESGSFSFQWEWKA